MVKVFVVILAPRMIDKLIATNKKAYHNFHLSQTWECGLALTGGEVKSVRAGEVNFKDSFARVQEDEIFLYSLHINPYKEASYLNDEPDRVRKLLLHKNEIRKLATALREKGFVLVPTKIYFNNRGFVKVELAVGKGKKLYDKRETVKNRDIDRDIKRRMRAYKQK